MSLFVCIYTYINAIQTLTLVSSNADLVPAYIDKKSFNSLVFSGLFFYRKSVENLFFSEEDGQSSSSSPLGEGNLHSSARSNQVMLIIS